MAVLILINKQNQIQRHKKELKRKRKEKQRDFESILFFFLNRAHFVPELFAYLNIFSYLCTHKHEVVSNPIY